MTSGHPPRTVESRSLEIRPATPADEPAILTMLHRTHGWARDEPHAELFHWKHRDNPFGRSPAWVAVDGEDVAGFRTFLRWEFLLDGRVVRAARAVDTATDARYQGRGVFTRLTLAGLEGLWSEGVEFVFNTPNRQSLSGYLKMGWKTIGRPPVRVRPTSLRSAARLIRARAPADKWSLPATAGLPATEVCADSAALASLLAQLPSGSGLRTRLSPEFLAWRYGLPMLAYRAVVATGGLEHGVAFLRLRRRGSAVEAVVCDVLARRGDMRSLARSVVAAARAGGADYALGLGYRERRWPGLPLPGAGPVLTYRGPETSAAPPGDWNLTLGDVELF